MLLFEEVYDEGIEFAYQPLREIPQICPKCGSLFFKNDCIVVLELFASLPSRSPTAAGPLPKNA